MIEQHGKQQSGVDTMQSIYVHVSSLPVKNTYSMKLLDLCNITNCIHFKITVNAWCIIWSLPLQLILFISLLVDHFVLYEGKYIEVVI